jgi:phosphatidate phosphatase PAH1
MSCVDIIGVIRDEDHVRTSPFCILFKNRPKEPKKVKILVNKLELSISMILQPNGNTVFDEKVISDEPISPLVKKQEEKDWKQKTIDFLTTRQHFASQVPDENLFSKCLKEHNIVNEMNVISFETDDEAVEGFLFLWTNKEKIVIVDIDGTITKSDVTGQLYTLLGKDYTHIGAAKLFYSIVKNGYKLIYLTARPITQVEVTREYLWNVDQDNFRLPRMPVITTPNSKTIAMMREVIIRTPQSFKIEILAFISMMFSASPFYAGFGNRHTDEISYDKHGIGKERIFIINKKSRVHYVDREFENYLDLCDHVDQYFPATQLNVVTDTVTEIVTTPINTPVNTPMTPQTTIEISTIDTKTELK